MAEARIGSVPLIEPAEEVRALVLRLCGAVLIGKSAETFGCEVCTYLCTVLILSVLAADPLPPPGAPLRDDVAGRLSAGSVLILRADLAKPRARMYTSN